MTSEAPDDTTRFVVSPAVRDLGGGVGEPNGDPMNKSPTLDEFLALPDAEKAKRFDAMARATFSHVDGRDLLDELHPRKQLDIKRRVDGVETWFEGDWLSGLRNERNGWLKGTLIVNRLP